MRLNRGGPQSRSGCGPEAEANARAEAIAQANALAARDPDQALGVLTRNNATFTERDLDRHLAKHIFEDGERGAVRTKVLGTKAKTESNGRR